MRVAAVVVIPATTLAAVGLTGGDRIVLHFKCVQFADAPSISGGGSSALSEVISERIH